MEVNIMEPSPHNNGRVLELQHCQVLHPENKLYINNKERFMESDVIFHTSGVNRKIIGSRMEVALDNITITKGVFGGCNFKNDPLVIVVSNPVDIVSYFTAKLPCLNPQKVIGTGTLLDSIRFSSAIANRYQVQGSDVKAMVLGEHGETMTLLFSQVKISGKTPEDEMFGNKDFRTIIRDETIFAAREIKKTQEATFAGVSECAVKIMDVYFSDQPEMMPVSVSVPKELMERLHIRQPIFYSLPMEVGNKKIEFKNHLMYTEEEWSQLRFSAMYLENVIKEFS